jgi:multiple sugar transport system permease protein
MCRNKPGQRTLKQANAIHWLWVSAMLAPAFLFLVAFAVYPALSSVFFSFTDWNGVSGSMGYVGLKNFAKLLADPWFWNAVQHTLTYALVLIAVQIPLALVLAGVLSSQNLAGKRLLKSLFFLPLATPQAIVSIVLSMLFVLGGTEVSARLLHWGVLERNIDWLGNPGTAFGMVTAVGIWMGLGHPLIYFCAGMQTIDQEMLDAARMDGAKPLASLRYVVIPHMKGIVLVVILTTALHSVRVFDNIQVMTRGGPYFATDVIGTYVYRLAFSSPTDQFVDAQVGLASAASLMMSLFTVCLALACGVLLRKQINPPEG